MRNSNWTETEQMKVVWNIVETEVIQKTIKNTGARAMIIDEIVSRLIADPNFSARLNAKNPADTIAQHIRAWIRYLEDGDDKPPLVK